MLQKFYSHQKFKNRKILKKAKKEKVPNDWVYIYNFETDDFTFDEIGTFVLGAPEFVLKGNYEKVAETPAE